MELSTFIADTLYQIQHGVALAIDRTKGLKGAVNPVWGTADDISAAHLQKVSFDIAVTVSETKTGTAGGEIKVVGIGLGGEKSKAEETSNVSRVQFTIPFIPAVQVVGKIGSVEQSQSNGG